MAVFIENDQCAGCGACVMACPNEALRLVQEGFRVQVEVTSERCTDCGACVLVCPVQVIHLPGSERSQAAPSGVNQQPLKASGRVEPDKEEAPNPASEPWSLRHWRPGRGHLRRRLGKRLGGGGRHRH